MAGRWPRAYLDVETDGPRQQLTVVGVRAGGQLTQLVGEEITQRRLQRRLPRRGWLYTFNGDAFDLRLIREQLGWDLTERLISVDLMRVCRSCGLRGGQKAIEESIGFVRDSVGLDGWGAVKLWRRHLAGDVGALDKLLGYNAEDVEGLLAVRRHLDSLGVL